MAKMIIDIPDDEYNYFMYSEDFDSDDGYDAIEFICNGIVLDNVTNGAVIKALFPDGKVIEREDGDIEYDIYVKGTFSLCILFDDLWWNAPYKPQPEKRETEGSEVSDA